MEKIVQDSYGNVDLLNCYDAPTATSKSTIHFFQMQKLWMHA